ncbi:ABC transporter permease [archaeon]|jgi:putative ABC transport system permease protein|nr:ABC transporter permease [archaeon]MBT3731361.1 ABC transporter permease [archaeon]MBT4670336.1 ABC transporter permease [archaeon]MBT5029646.1 ABC transporter permease [archaeon]MBT5287605.1 ABC transporter permease [archaeon]
MIDEFIMFSWNNMKHKQLRSWLTIIGVIIGIAAIVSLISLGDGFESAIVEQFNVLGADKIRVTPAGLTGPPTGVEGLTTDDLEVVEDVRGVDYAGGVIFETASVEYNNVDGMAFLKGIDNDLVEEGKIDVNLDLEEGDWFSSGERKVVIIGNSFAKEYFNKEILVKNSIIIEDEKFKVVGILETSGDQATDGILYIPLEDAKDIYDKDDGINFIYATVEEGEDINEVAERVAIKLEDARDDDDFLLITPESLLTQLGSILSVVQFILGGIAGISLVVGGIGIMNSMFTSVLERTKQIGLMKAVGASKEKILLIFVMEAALIGVTGGVMGVVLGYVFAFSVQGVAALLGFSYLKISILWNVVGLSLGFALLVGILSGLYPAYKASGLSPVEALRYE